MRQRVLVGLAGVGIVVAGGLALLPRPARPVFQKISTGLKARLGEWDIALGQSGAVRLENGRDGVTFESRIGEPSGELRLAEGGGAVLLQRGEVTERWHLSAQGLEQAWMFARPPTGDAPWVVSVSVAGAVRRSLDERGVVLTSRGGPRLRYGNATWVDARGRQTPIPARLDGEQISFRIPRELLEQSAYPAVLDPVISPEQPASVDTVPVTLVRQQTQPAVAIIGTTALVVWTDSRRAGALYSVETDIYGALVDLSGGTIAMGQRFPIAVAPGTRLTPAVAAGPSDFLVVWADTSGASSDIWGADIPVAGVTGRPATFPIAATAQAEILPAVAYSDAESRFLVVFDSNNGIGPIKAARVDLTVSPPTVSASFTVSSSPDPQTSPSVAWSGAQYVITWADIPSGGGNRNVYFSRLAASATTVTSTAQLAGPINSDKSAPSVVAGPNEHLILWADNRNSPGTPDLYGDTVQANGLVGSVGGTLLRTGGGGVGSPHGSFMLSGLTAYGTVFSEFSATPHVTTAWFSPGTLAPFGGVDSFGPQATGGVGIAVTTNGNFDSIVAYADGNDVSLVPGMTIGVLNPAGTAVLTALPAQEESRVASLPGQALLAWSQWNGLDGGNDFYFRRYAWDGGALDAVPQPLRVGPPMPDSLQLTAGATEYYALYSELPSGGIRPDVFAASISPSGAVGPPIGVATSGSAETASSLAFNGNNYEAFYQLHRLSGGGLPFEVLGQQFTPGGALVGGPFLVHSRGLSIGDFIRGTASAAASSGATLVAVDYLPLQGIIGQAVYATVVSGGGSSTPTGGLVRADAGFPTVASDGQNFLVVWEDYDSPTSPDLFGQRFDTSGAPVDPSPVPIEVGASRPEKPNVTFNGSQYLLTWHERLATGAYQIHARWLSPTLQDLNDALVAGADDHVLPRAASDGQGSSWLSFVRIADDGDPAVPRVSSVIASAGLPGDPCTSNGQCFGGFCVGGVCCNVACSGACQTCLQTAGALKDGTCGAKTLGTVCRPSDAGCDAVEVCDGVHPTCPADGAADAGTVCRPAAGDCDAVEVCDGTGFLCPADSLKDAGTVCQSTALPCALSGTCSGTSPICPATGVRPADFVCRPRVGACDVDEKCDGVAQTCPPDGFAASSVVCRPAAGQCDAPEHCSGNDPLCPADLLAPTTTVCRPAAGVCDVAEHCDGTSSACPADAFATAQQVCSPAAPGNECDADDVCPGNAVSCGPDLKKPDGTSCAQGSGTCQAGVCKPLQRSRYSWGCGGCGAGGGGLGLFALMAWLGFRRRARALVVALSLVTALSALADPAPLKLVFNGVAPGNGVSPETAKSVAEYVQTELTRVGTYAVVSQTDLQALIGLERQKQLLGCSDSSSNCLTEMLGALDADRLLRAELSRLDETMVLNLSLVDLRKSHPVGRVTRTVESGGVSAVLREIPAMINELLNQAPENQAAPLVLDRGFGGIVIGVRADADLLAKGVAPGLSAEFSGRFLGGAVTVLVTPTPGIRGEARFFPLTLKSVRPYLVAGSTVFSTGLGIRVGAGASVRFGHIQLAIDAGYERYVLDFKPGYSDNALVLGLGMGWQI